jgi:hypothetical protein
VLLAVRARAKIVVAVPVIVLPSSAALPVMVVVFVVVVLALQPHNVPHWAVSDLIRINPTLWYWHVVGQQYMYN